MPYGNYYQCEIVMQSGSEKKIKIKIFSYHETKKPEIYYERVLLKGKVNTSNGYRYKNSRPYDRSVPNFACLPFRALLLLLQLPRGVNRDWN